VAAMFFSPETVRASFLSLRPSGEATGKKNLERTTALGVFLAFDMTQRQAGGIQVLDLRPPVQGRSERQRLIQNYCQLLTPSFDPENSDLVMRALGELQKDSLSNAISSNFLTTPLSRARSMTGPQGYPGRPPKPLLLLGVDHNGMRWGTQKHPDWANNFGEFLTNRQCLDDCYFSLIVYLLRHEDISSYSGMAFKEGLKSALGQTFTPELSEYLIGKVADGVHDWSEPGIFSDEYDEPDYPAFLAVEPPASEVEGLTPEVEWPASSEKLDLGELVIPEDVVARAIAALQSGNHLILIGPPGTGKTSLAERLATAIKGDAYRVHTATSDWTTHEVVGGYMPNPARPNVLVFTPGIVTRAIDLNRWLIIDEINRADVDKAFGELFTLLANGYVELTQTFQDYDDSHAPIGPPKRIVLRLIRKEIEDNPEDVFVAAVSDPDWRMIGTMNTLDKAALYQLSYAFMRRFAFVTVPAPDPDQCRTIIDKRIEPITQKLAGDTSRLSIWGDIAGLIRRVFADASTGLHAATLPVGASIPLDIINYLKYRIEQADAVDAKRLVCEALDMFLLPQFEGLRRKHSTLVDNICDAVGLTSEEEQSRVNISVGSWTGALDGV
jgi:DNA polymerase III delta prime subunit